MVDSRLIRYAEVYAAAAIIPPHPAPPGTERYKREERERLNKKLEELPLAGEGENMEEKNREAMAEAFEAHKQQNTALYQAALNASKTFGMSALKAFSLIGDHYNQTGEIPYVPEGISPEIEKEVQKLVYEYEMTEEDARSIVESQYAAKGSGPEVVEHIPEDEIERVAALRKVFKYASPGLLKWAARI